MSDRIDALTHDVISLKQDMAKVDLLVGRLDITIDKLTDISSHLSQLLAVHETKLHAQGITNQALSDSITRTEENARYGISEVHERIDNIEEKIGNKVDSGHDKILEAVKNQHETAQEQYTSLNKRISTLEKWFWIFTGMAIFVSFIVSGGLIDLTALL